MQNDFEPPLAALYAQLVAAAAPIFTGNTTAGNATISNVSSTAGLFSGLPVFGQGVAKLAVIDSFDAQAQTVTLDQPIETGLGGTGLSFTAGFQLTGRRLKHWSQCEGEQPALFLTHTGSEDVYDGTILPKTMVEAEVWIYSRAGEDPDAAPDTALNALCELVRATIAARDNFLTNQNTLGGLCQWCRVEGKTDYDPGDQDSQSKAVIPVKILLP